MRAAVMAWICAALAHAQPPTAPRWSVDLGTAPDWAVARSGAFVIASRGQIERRDIASGALLGGATIPDEPVLYPADAGRRFAIFELSDPADGQDALGVSMGGYGNDPVHMAYAINPETGRLRWLRTIAALRMIGVEHAGLVVAWSDGPMPELLGLDAATGNTRWQTTIPRQRWNTGDVFVDDASVYYLSYDGLAAALDRDGTLRWSRRLQSDRNGIALHDARLIRGRMVLAHDASITALDPATGRELWRFAAFSPQIEAIGEDEVAVLAHGAGVSIVSAATGAARLTHALANAALLERVGPYVVAQGDELLVLDAATGQERARLPFRWHGAIRASGDRLVAIAAPTTSTRPPVLIAVDVEAGTTWRERRVGPESPIAIAGDVVVACSAGGVARASISRAAARSGASRSGAA